MKILHCLNVKNMFKCVLFNLNLILYKKSLNLKMLSIKSRVGDKFGIPFTNISRHPVYICLQMWIPSDNMTETKDALCDRHLLHSLRKLDRCDLFFAQQKYRY